MPDEKLLEFESGLVTVYTVEVYVGAVKKASV